MNHSFRKCSTLCPRTSVEPLSIQVISTYTFFVPIRREEIINKTDRIKYIINFGPSVTLQLRDFRRYFPGISCTLNLATLHLQWKWIICTAVYMWICTYLGNKTQIIRPEYVMLSLEWTGEISMVNKGCFQPLCLTVLHRCRCAFSPSLSLQRIIETISCVRQESIKYHQAVL